MRSYYTVCSPASRFQALVAQRCEWEEGYVHLLHARLAKFSWRRTPSTRYDGLDLVNPIRRLAWVCPGKSWAHCGSDYAVPRQPNGPRAARNSPRGDSDGLTPSAGKPPATQHNSRPPTKILPGRMSAVVSFIHPP